jgi:hypothetical protein
MDGRCSFCALVHSLCKDTSPQQKAHETPVSLSLAPSQREKPDSQAKGDIFSHGRRCLHHHPGASRARAASASVRAAGVAAAGVRRPIEPLPHHVRAGGHHLLQAGRPDPHRHAGDRGGRGGAGPAEAGAPGAQEAGFQALRAAEQHEEPQDALPSAPRLRRRRRLPAGALAARDGAAVTEHAGLPVAGAWEPGDAAAGVRGGRRSRGPRHRREGVLPPPVPARQCRRPAAAAQAAPALSRAVADQAMTPSRFAPSRYAPLLTLIVVLDLSMI